MSERRALLYAALASTRVQTTAPEATFTVGRPAERRVEEQRIVAEPGPQERRDEPGADRRVRSAPDRARIAPDPDRQGARRQRVLPAALGAGDRHDPGAGAALRDPRHPPLPAGAGPPSADDPLADPPPAGVMPGQQGFL